MSGWSIAVLLGLAMVAVAVMVGAPWLAMGVCWFLGGCAAWDLAVAIRRSVIERREHDRRHGA